MIVVYTTLYLLYVLRLEVHQRKFADKKNHPM